MLQRESSYVIGTLPQCYATVILGKSVYSMVHFGFEGEEIGMHDIIKSLNRVPLLNCIQVPSLSLVF